MRRLCALLGLVALVLAACGRYGPPVRTRPARPLESTQAAAPVAPGEPVDAEAEKEKSP